MMKPKVWISKCHFRQMPTPNNSDLDIMAYAAVWTHERQQFEDLVREKIPDRDFTLLWAEEVFPANSWLAQYGYNADIMGLARSVTDENPVEIGAFMDANKSIDSGDALITSRYDLKPLKLLKGMPFGDSDWIQPNLKKLLFAQPDDNQIALRTYLIVDATLRKNITGVFDLDDTGLPVRCLFKGDAAEGLKYVAPYLVDVTLPEGAFEDRYLVPYFHKSFFAKHWGKNTGIFIRSTAPMDDIYKHFRKFTKVKIEGSEDWQFFRFWDPQTAGPYFGTMKNHATRIQQWFGGSSITLNSIVAEQEAGKKVISFAPCANLDLSSNRPTGMLVLTPDELAPFAEIQAERDIALTVELLRKSFSKELNHMSDDLLNREVHRSVTRMQEYGIHRKENLFITSAWAAFFGGEFETKDPQGQMENICRSNLPESEKMKKLKSRIADLKTKEPTT